MIEDKIKWNKKYLNPEVVWKDPSEIVKKYYKYAKIGKALDLACGNGRNSKFLAKAGFFVDAIDISDVALKNIQNFKNINPIEADLDSYRLKKDYYDLIICINYLNRNLFSKIKESLKADGVLIYESLVYDESLDLDMKREYLLDINELLHVFLDHNIIYYEEKIIKNLKEERVRKAYLVCKSKKCR